MRRILVALFAACVSLWGYSGYGEALSMKEMSLELEDAFLDKPKALKGELNRMAPRAAASGAGAERPPLTEGEKWQAKLAAILDIPAAPTQDGFNIKMLEAPGTRFIVAVFDTGERGVVHKARQIAWHRIRTLFTGGAMPLIHVVPVMGGTFSAGRTFYTIMNDKDGFNVFYIPQKAARKVSLGFSGGEGVFLTPDGFVCRVKRYTPDAGGVE